MSCLQAVCNLSHFPWFTSGTDRQKQSQNSSVSRFFGALRDFKTYRPESRANFSRYCESNRRGHFIHPPLRYPVANVSQRSRKPVDMSQRSRNISLRIRCSNPFRDFSDQPRRYLVLNRKKTIKIYVEFISIAIFREFLQFPRLR